ncbi:MAG: hypothetical protein Q9M92_13760 [Enterobacterales bacterium]|nr:hypothetical protein [Enterobacterales bacterium]
MQISCLVKFSGWLKISLTENSQSNGIVDLASLKKLSDKIKPLEKIKPTSYQRLKQQLLTAIANTSNKIQSLKSEWNEQAPTSGDALETLREIAMLAGEASKESEIYDKARQVFIQSTAKQARTAYADRNFDRALDLSKKGLQIDPANLVFESLSTQSKLALFEQKFRSSMEQGKPEQAYQYLIAMKDKPIIELIKRRMTSSINLLAKYFANSARLAYLHDGLYNAFIAFTKGRSIQKILDRGDLGFPQERMFLDKVMLKANSTKVGLGIKYGLLMLVHQFDSEYPSLNQQLTQTLKKLSKRATTKLYISDFKEVASTNSVIASVGRRVSKQLESILFNRLGQQVQILSQPIVVRQEDQEYSELEGAIVTIRGDVLQAAIETSYHLGQRTINVLTNIERIQTEEYTKWSKRNKGEAPQRYKERKIMQDVLLNVKYIKKIAVLEISYQVIDPVSHKVILTKELLKEQEFKGESIAELKKGLFYQKYQESDLPSDIKIIDLLAKRISVELGDSLIEYLIDPEELFYKKYEKNLKQGLRSSAVEYLANALVLNNEQDTAAHKQQLVNLALQN